MFAFAALVIHRYIVSHPNLSHFFNESFTSVFRTSHHDVNINETSSYVDLAPLYGHNAEVQERVRAYNGLGYLHPDTFGEDRLLLLPPAVCAILVLFNRNHNVCLLWLRTLISANDAERCDCHPTVYREASI